MTAFSPPSAGHDCYDPAFFERLSAIEDRHFWFRARRKLILAQVKRVAVSFPHRYRILEVGCGTGNVLRGLEEACPGGTLLGVDMFPEALRYARKHTTSWLVQADIRTPPFSRPFDLIGMFDVLEHMPDDVGLLRDLHSVLTPDGRLLLTVPAHQFLWSHVDETARHCRRYSRAELRDKLAAAGYAVDCLTYFMMSMLPLVWLTRRVAGLFATRTSPERARTLACHEMRLFPVVNSALMLLLELEHRWLSRGHSLPTGTSLLALARKV